MEQALVGIRGFVFVVSEEQNEPVSREHLALQDRASGQLRGVVWCDGHITAEVLFVIWVNEQDVGCAS